MAVRRRTVLLLVLAVVTAGCEISVDSGTGIRGSGELVTESREVSGFDEIVVLGSGSVVVEVTGTESLSVRAEDNLLPHLTTEVHNGRLELGTDESINPTTGITYTITASDLAALSISGSGDIQATGIDSDRLEVSISGSGDVTPEGVAEELDVQISGSGAYRGDGLAAEHGEVSVSGSGNAVVYATEDLNVSVSGSGYVEYLGDPVLDQHVSGSGTISRR